MREVYRRMENKAYIFFRMCAALWHITAATSENSFPLQVELTRCQAPLIQNRGASHKCWVNFRIFIVLLVEKNPKGRAGPR